MFELFGTFKNIQKAPQEAPRKTMKFTDRKLLGLKPRESRYEVREQDGFVMQIYPSGKKVFQFVYSAHKKKHRVTIGE